MNSSILSTQNISQSHSSTLNYLKDTLKECGVLLSFHDGPNILTQEQSLVVRNIEHFLLNNSEEGCVQKLVSGLIFVCRKHKYFRNALLATEIKNNDSGNANVHQECLFRILLKVNSLQKDVMEILLEEIIKIASEDNDDTSWLRLLLKPLRYLPHIVDSEKLTTNLLDTLEISTLATQLEILDSIPEIVPDNQYHETAKQLTKLLDNNENLSAAIIDCFNALNLEPDIRLQIQDRILAKLLEGTVTKIFPILLEFLLSDCKSQNSTTVLIKIRTALDTVMSESDPEKETNKIVTFNKLQMFSLTKFFVEGCLNIITSIKVDTDCKPVDLLLLFILHSTSKLKKRSIELIIRKRVKERLFKCTLLEKFFEKYLPQQIFKDQFNSIVEIGCNLLRTSEDATVLEFGTTLFKLLFTHKHCEAIYRQELIDNLLIMMSGSDNKHVNAVMNVFKVFHEEDSEKLKQNVILLMGLLENIEALELDAVKDVFEILCALTCTNEEDARMGVRDELYILVRKQLSSNKKNVTSRGIVAAVTMAKFLATSSEDQSDISVSEDTINLSNLPRGHARDAALLMEQTNTCVSGVVSYMGLYYDQLATILITSNNLDKYFLAWLQDTTTSDFQNIFITDSVPGAINDMEFSRQFELNTVDETNARLGINIGALTMDYIVSENNSILIIAPYFRFLRLLHYHYYGGDLSSIDALLGCAVILPPLDNIDSLDYDQLQQVADCLYHCCNWFREVVSGFITQRGKTLKRKVLERLRNLIEVEELLKSVMNKIPDHRLPQCYFASNQIQIFSPKRDVKVKQQKKRAKSDETVHDQTIASTSSLTVRTQPKPGKKTVQNEVKINFREVDTDVLLLLKYPLKLEVEPGASQDLVLTLGQLNFILQDFANKLNVMTKMKKSDSMHLKTVQPKNLITDCKHILAYLNQHLSVINEKLDKLLQKTDGRHDLNELYTSESLEIKKSFGLMIECLWLVFSWTGFQHTKNLDLLREILKAFRGDATKVLNSANLLIVELINRLSNCADRCLHLSHGVHLIKTMESLNSVIPNSEMNKVIINTSHKLLGKVWYNNFGHSDSGKDYLLNIDTLVKVYLDGASVKILGKLIATLQKESSELKSKEDYLLMLPSINKGNFYILYRNVCNALHVRIKTEVQAITNKQHLELWQTTVLSLQELKLIIHHQESKSNLSCFLKKSIAILKVFLSHGIPILEITLRSHSDRVVEILKTMQSTTRYLHHLCCHSKVTKDSSLVPHVPQFRLTLETLIYRVKAALVANDCSAAFWMGNLRNKDLAGEDILSQSTTLSESNNGAESEEELPPDESDDEIAAENSRENENKSDSEVYD